MKVFHIHIKGTDANIFSIPLPKVNWFTYFSLALEPFSGHKVETPNRGELVTELCKNQWQNYVSIVKSRNDTDKLCKYLQLPPLSSYYSFTHDVSELFRTDASQQHHWSLKKKRCARKWCTACPILQEFFDQKRRSVVWVTLYDLDFKGCYSSEITSYRFQTLVVM